MEQMYEDQYELNVRMLKKEARKTALDMCPSRRIDTDGREIPLTASEIVEESQKIYEWLIKDL